MTMFEVLLLAFGLVAQDTTFVMAEASRDMTGDGKAEDLLLVASGSVEDSLAFVFTISDGPELLYEDRFIADRLIGPEGNLVASDSDWNRVVEYYRDFFGAERFSSARVVGIERRLDEASPPYGSDLDSHVWGRLLASETPVFRYSPGGDRSYSLAWVDASFGFIDMYPCC